MEPDEQEDYFYSKTSHLSQNLFFNILIVNKMNKINLTFFCLIIMTYFACSEIIAQPKTQAKFDPAAWDVSGEKHEFVTYKGKTALYLENSSSRLKGSKLKNGIIDFDLAFDEGRKFLGVHFRGQDGRNYEEFYLRAHQSGNPDAMQYTPVFNGVSGWQLYSGKGHSTAYRFNFEEWMHIRLVIADGQMEVFINDMSLPILPVHDLKQDALAGEIGFSASLGGAYFANLTYQEIERPVFVTSFESLPQPDKEVLQNWQISTGFTIKDIATVNQLDQFKLKNQLKWQTQAVEYSGLLNVSKTAMLSASNNTVLVKAVINADSDQIKRLDIGYSDVAKVFVNNQAVYAGQRKFRSRDYRYLGTIGYFDSIFLDLKKGRNEVVFALAENMGGWAVMAKLENIDGISFE